jgi:glycerol-3-phosphate dehydrogenase
MHLAKELKVDVPICHAVYRIVHEKHDVNVVVKELLAQF